MGLVTANTVGLSGIVAPKPNVQMFQTAGSTTWTKPPGCTRVYIEVIGGGGGGSGGNAESGASASGGGGGGGAMARGVYSAESLPASLTVVVAAVANGGSGAASATNAGAAGSAGNYSEVTGSGFILKAWGGGAGGAPTVANSSGAGGGGGGTGAAGAAGANGMGAGGIGGGSMAFGNLLPMPMAIAPST